MFPNLNYVLNKRRPDINLFPPDYDKPEGFCITCRSFTTNYSRHGECSECGTEVVRDLVEVNP